MTYKVAYIIGSLSSNSINRKLVGAMIADAPSDLEFVEADFSKLPLYSPDYDADYPQIATDFKKILEDADAVLIATPEYDRSIPGGLKNAIDWFGRPWGSNPIGGRRFMSWVHLWERSVLLLGRSQPVRRSGSSTPC